MNVFLDTNVLLGLYKLTGPDLEEVRRLIKLAEAAKFTVLVNDIIVDEFNRNRQKVIAASLTHLDTLNRGAAIPNLVKSYAEAGKLRDCLNDVNAAVIAVKAVALTEIAKSNLKADQLVAELFQKFKPLAVTEAVITKARRRFEFGRPPAN